MTDDKLKQQRTGAKETIREWDQDAPERHRGDIERDELARRAAAKDAAHETLRATAKDVTHPDD